VPRRLLSIRSFSDSEESIASMSVTKAQQAQYQIPALVNLLINLRKLQECNAHRKRTDFAYRETCLQELRKKITSGATCLKHQADPRQTMEMTVVGVRGVLEKPCALPVLG